MQQMFSVTSQIRKILETCIKSVTLRPVNKKITGGRCLLLKAHLFSDLFGHRIFMNGKTDGLKLYIGH